MIDADELWEQLKKSMISHIVTNTLFNTIKATIDGTPTIDPVKHGKWIVEKVPYEKQLKKFTCSECGYDFETISEIAKKFKYCRNCGAKMDK